MPSKSKAQVRAMGRLYGEGKIDRQTLREFNSGVDYKSLPERVSQKDVRKKKRRARKSTRAVRRAAGRRGGRK